MDTNTSHLIENNIGQVFTPLEWAEWLINKWNIFDAWVDGAHICDPTAGQGVFAFAMLHLARKRGIAITPERLSRITLIEMIPSHLEQFKIDVKGEFSIDFPDSQTYCQDIITQKHDRKYDILIGNPPWVNFGDLPATYKTEIKPYFILEGLVADARGTLLGSSRVDIAALVLKVVLGKLLKLNGLGCFYLPTSLFFGDGAHKGFRSYSTQSSQNFFETTRHFAIDSVFEFTSTKVFEGVNTAYCCAKIQDDLQQEFPVSYFRESKGNWIEYKAVPLKNPDDPWRIAHSMDELKKFDRLEIGLTPEQNRDKVSIHAVQTAYSFLMTNHLIYLTSFCSHLQQRKYGGIIQPHHINGFCYPIVGKQGNRLHAKRYKNPIHCTTIYRTT